MSEAERREPTDEAVVPGEEVQVFSIEEDGSHVLDEKELGEILLADHVKDKPVVVISATGTLRQGKSFLMNFLLRYADKRSKDNWLGDSNAPLEGFTWRGGCDAVTKGILFWSKVFLVKTPKGTQKEREVAVVLMDTQGTFDLESDTKDWTTIIALSTMISSVQIYNIVRNIKSNDLEDLLFFAEYADLAKEDRDGGSFQKLLFLIRDWNSKTDFGYGYEGGRSFLNRRLSTCGKKSQELRGLRERIWSWFEEVDCFLMPHPGLTVDSEEFYGRVTEIDEDFLQNLSALVKSILDPATLLVKKIDGREITCRDLYSYIKAFAGMFQGDKLPTPTSWREAMAKGQNMAAAAKAIEIYEIGMANMFTKDAPKASFELLDREHERFRKEALDHFQSTRKMGGQEMSKRYEESVEKVIQGRYECFARHITSEVNAAKKLWKVGAACASAGGLAGLAIGTCKIIPARMIYKLLEVALAGAGAV